jgi:hypothetical protein
MLACLLQGSMRASLILALVTLNEVCGQELLRSVNSSRPQIT